MNRKYLGMITICFMILNMCGCQSTIGTNIKPPTDQTYGKINPSLKRLIMKNK